MCWKAIDFGRSSAVVLDTDNAEMLNMTVEQLRPDDYATVIVKAALSVHALEMLDILRLLAFSIATLGSGEADLELPLKEVYVMAAKVSADSDCRGTLLQAINGRVAVSASTNARLMEALFMEMAKEFEVADRPPSPSHVFESVALRATPFVLPDGNVAIIHPL
jgi:hypothetical protein